MILLHALAYLVGRVLIALFLLALSTSATAAVFANLLLLNTYFPIIATANLASLAAQLLVFTRNTTFLLYPLAN